ncbi:MAG: aminopeptidase N [Gammaproteobacteria bacterium RIFCSPHIGHO2_12_FULL_42_13]|nr:MAG: aminopeptidase N [Gammaproteobacteria bacterium RIFCSPHIGHO2_12_FULL_42_13]
MLMASESTTMPATTYLNEYTAPDYTVNKIDLHFELKEPFTIVKSHMDIARRIDTNAATQHLFLSGEDLNLDSITLDQQLLDKSQYTLTTQGLLIHQVPDHFELTIQTRINPQENTQLSGLYRSRDFYCTQCEAEGFRRITYFLDRPDVLTRFTTTIVADKTRYPILLSNGNLIGSGELENGKHWVKWEDPFKKPSYLFALVAGDFDVVEDFFITQSGRRITLGVYVEKGYLDQTQHAMQSIKKAMRWDEENYGREYDLDIYMIVAIDDFNMGAMENKGLNIFNTKYILAKGETATDEDFVHIESVIAHEYFHNWSGNRVTCRDWFQLSLKEGLTIFRDQSFTHDSITGDVARIHEVNSLRLTQFPEDAGPLAHPVRPESYIEINNFYTTTIYNKGAEVIRMIQTILGKNAFRKAMDLYFSRHDGQAVTIEDFVKAMEDASGVDLLQFRLWYSQAGTPTLEIDGLYNQEKQTYTLTIKQSCPDTPGQTHKKPLHIPIKVGLLDNQGQEISLHVHNEKPELIKTLQLKKPEEQYEFSQVKSRPTPSLLRDFSAPVKLHFNYSNDDLKLLFTHDSNGFNRWEAGQQYAERVLLQLISDYQQKKPLTIFTNFIAVLRQALDNHQIQDGLLANMLTLPSERYIAEQMLTVDVDAIHAVREHILLAIAKELEPLLAKTYQQCHSPKQPYLFNNQEMGKRQLKNICLAYLMLLANEDYTNLGKQQFEQSLLHNMTDTMAALRSLVNLDSSISTQVLDQFYNTWQKEALIVNKWLAIQASSKSPNTLCKVKSLFKHEAFDIKNPNKVYALLGGFCQHNLVRFHVNSGEGYELLRDSLLQLDKLNPQVAARMITPLTEWKRYDSHRQRLMQKQLEFIVKQNSVSKDIYELVSKSLV